MRIFKSVLTFFMFGFFTGFTSLAAEQKDTLTIVCFGNSTTAPRKNIEKVYPQRLQEILNTKRIRAKIVNAGLGGSHAASISDNSFHKIKHAKDRFDEDVLSKIPDWVIISFGINDSWQDQGPDGTSRISLELFSSSLIEFIRKSKAASAKVILLTSNPLGQRFEEFRKKRLNQYNQVILQLAHQYKLPCVDVNQVFLQASYENPNGVDAFLLDGMHPNDEGHRLIASHLYPYLDPNKSNGTITSTGFWMHPKASEIKGLRTGPFIHLPQGKLMTVDGTHAFTSSDQGKTWDSTAIFDNVGLYLIRPERALIRSKKGTLLLAFANDRERTVFNWSKTIHDAPNAELPTYIVRSEDDGKTWSQPMLLHKEWTGAIRDIIETKDGHIVFTSMMMRHNPGHHAVVTYTSKDDGLHWQRSNIIDIGGVGDHDGATESTLEELKDGSLYMLLRTNLGYFWETRSVDKGQNWSAIKSTKIDASSSPGMIKRLSSGRLMLVWNRYFPEGENSYPLKGGDSNFSSAPVSMHREEIAVMFSSDDGSTWTQPTVIASTIEPKTQIAYPYLIEISKGKIWLSFAFSALRIGIRERDFLH